MGDTGAPWNLRYPDPTDLVVDGPAQFEELADDVAAGLSAAAFDDSETITATDASWTVPSLANPVVKVTVVGGGGSGGSTETVGNAGGTTTFNAGGAGTVTAAGGAGGRQGNVTGGGSAASVGLVSGNGGGGGVLFESAVTDRMADGGRGGRITVDYLDLTGISTVNVTIGAGGAQASGAGFGAAGGRGEVIVEYKAA